MTRILATIFLFFVLILSGCQTPNSNTTSFQVKVSEDAIAAIESLGLDTPVQGRLFVVISRDDSREPRLQTGVSGVPFWGIDVEGLKAGDIVELKADVAEVRGYPFESLSELPAGSYFAQAVLSVYTKFERSDGHTVSIHLNSGAGQNQWRAPGNAISPVVNLEIDPAKGRHYQLELTNVIPPDNTVPAGGSLQQGNPPDTNRVKFVKIRSTLLSDFWGRDMYVGANVLLPEGYDESSQSYPVMYMQGHFPGGSSPLGYSDEGEGRGRGAGLSDYWRSSNSPKMFAVTFRDANPYYDTSYSVNSENLGPYGDAITQELVPYLESQFRIIP